MVDPLRFGGQPLLTLTPGKDAPAEGPAFTQAQVLPGRGMMLLQARLRLPSGRQVDGLFAPTPADAARQFDGEADFAGNLSFAFGGAILAPFANRIRGRPVEGARAIETEVAGKTVRLPRNWGGKAAGAEQYAMHGLILEATVPFAQPKKNLVHGRFNADFEGSWPSRAELSFEWRLERGELALKLLARNIGNEPMPLGLGFHPYIAIPSGDRAQARLRLPARRRAEVDNYDQVLPTGVLSEVAGTAYDFNAEGGAPLGETYLDDCYTDLPRPGGKVVVEVIDPKAGVGIRVSSPTREVKAVQVYAPPEQAFVVVEPQFNLAEPFSAIWPAGTDTGMATLKPGQELTYEVRVAAFAVGT